MQSPPQKTLSLLSIAAATVLAGTGRAQTPPEDVLGFKPGADFHLANYEQAMEYFEVLDSETDRMQMLDMGETSYGRRMRYAVISSAENLARLDEYKDINRRLSLARGIGGEEAEQLADAGKAIVWIDGGLHASEVAPAQHNLQLAYDMVVDDDRRTRLIRDQVILVLVFANPDGMSLIANWYMGNVGTIYETSGLPELYQKYAGHDNNRDSMLSNLVETRNMNRATSHEWFPDILYNHHQTAPFPARIFIPPEAESTNPNVHPLVLRWKNLIGSAMGKSFEEAGQPGAISRINYDNWWPGYVTQIVESHNIPAILTETALYSYATPRYYTIGDFPAAHRDLVVGTFYPSPWEGGWWRLGDAVDYCLTASKSVLEVAAKFRFEFLYNKWRMATDVMERFENEPPYGWIISKDQRDATTTATLLERMMVLGTEVYTADDAFTHSGIEYPAGSFVIPTSQPFGLFVKNVLEIQDFPDLREHPHLWQGLVGTVNMNDAAPLRPYDGVGWTLPAQMGVSSHSMSRPLDEAVSLTQLDSAEAPAGAVERAGSHYVFSHADNNSFLALNRILAAGGNVSWALEEFDLHGVRQSKGNFLVSSDSIGLEALRTIASETRIPMTGGNPEVESHALKPQRIALYKSWSASMDAGWIRLLLETYGFDYHLLTDAEVRAGRLHERFDVILLPDQGAGQIRNGRQKGTIHPNYVGGVTQAGVENLIEFARKGGTLVSNKNSNDLLVTELRLPVRNALSGVSRNDFNIPGSILRMHYEDDHPLAFGLASDGVAYFAAGARGYELVTEELLHDEAEEKAARAEGDQGQRGGQGGAAGQQASAEDDYDMDIEVSVAARYPEKPLLISGWQVGEENLQGKAAVLDASIGDGKIVLFGFNVHNRMHTFSTFKLLFNAIYNR